MMKTTLFTFSFFIFLISCSSFAAPEWTVAIYAGLDEEEVASFGDPILAKLLEADALPDVQLLVEHDTALSDGVIRTEVSYQLQPQKIVTTFPELDSADQNNFANFLAWVKQRQTGRGLIVILMTHSWGWKGIIQDFTIPNAPDANTMMTFPNFGQALRDSGLKTNILFLDSCVAGNVEIMQDLRGTADFIVASQRETPYSGFPYDYFFDSLKNFRVSQTRALSATMPGLYAKSFGRSGALAPIEKEYNVVTVVTVDMSKWDNFVNKFDAMFEH